MKKADILFDEYGESHQDHTNKAIHWICVPLIVFSLIGLVWSIPSPWLSDMLNGHPFANWATVIVGLAMIYYLALSWQLAVGLFLYYSSCLLLAYIIDVYLAVPLWLVALVIFVLAWVGQFYGHKIEGKKPSFLKDVQFLLIGPAWLMHFIYKKLGLPY